MKKFVKIIALMMIVVMSLALLVSCAPNSNPDKAAEALENNGYTTTKIKDDNPLTSATFTGIELALGCSRGDLVARVKGVKTVEKDDKKTVETVTIWYFKDAAAANKVWEKAKVEADKDENKDESKGWIVAISGAMIYYGTSAAIKAAK